MAIEKTIKISIDTSKPVKSVKELGNEIEELTRLRDETNDPKKLIEYNKQIKKLTKDQEKLTEATEDSATAVNDLNKNGKKSKNSLGAVSKGFKGIGLAIKAAGIGFVIGLLATLKNILFSNQKVIDAFSVGLEAVTIVFNEVFQAIEKSIESISKATGGFDALGKVISGLITLGFMPLKLAFFSIKLGLQQAQLAWETSFFGDDDPKTIKSLTEGINETKDSIKEVSEEAVKAGLDVAKNISEAISEVGALGESIIENVSKVEVESALAQAKVNVRLKNSAEIAAAQQALLVEQYDRQAEKLRQIRDNDLKSIADRKVANDELLQVLAAQEKAMLLQADAILASASAQAAKNNTTENATALLEAQANKAGVLAQIEGFRSEQEANRVALLKESIELEQSGSEATEQRALKEKEFRAEQESDEIKQLQLKRDILAAERVVEEERLQLKIDSFEKGTQARLDAENELRDRLQELDQQDEVLATEKRDKELEKSLEDAENEAIAFEERRAILDARAKEIANDATLTDDQRTKLEKENSDARKKLGDEELKAKIKQGAALSSALNTASELLGKSTAAGKVAAIASTTIDTISSGVSAFKGMVSSIPGPVGIAAGAVAAAGALASGFASVKKILAVKTPGGGGGGAPSAPTPPQAPAFNLVGQSGVNQVQESIESESNPIKAFVVGSDVTNQQEIDSAQASSASLG